MVTQANITETKNGLHSLISELDALPSIPQPVLEPNLFDTLYPVTTVSNTKKNHPVTVRDVNPDSLEVVNEDDYKLKGSFPTITKYFKDGANFHEFVISPWLQRYTNPHPTLFFKTEKEADDYLLIARTLDNLKGLLNRS